MHVLLSYNLAARVTGKIVQVIIRVLLYLVIIESTGLAGVALGPQKMYGKLFKESESLGRYSSLAD
jgi:hypothetical protein